MNDTSFMALIVAGLSFIGNVIFVVIQIFKDRKKDRAEEAKLIAESKKIDEEAEKIKAEGDNEAVNTALSLVTPLKQRIKELEIELRAVVVELKSIEKLLIRKDNRIFELEENEQMFINEIQCLTKRIKELEDGMVVLKEENMRLKQLRSY